MIVTGDPEIPNNKHDTGSGVPIGGVGFRTPRKSERLLNPSRIHRSVENTYITT
jgi:hypothetical protein